MGQYFKLVNLDKREFVDPHVVGTGLKQYEQIANCPGTASACIVLLSAQRERRGGGDVDPEGRPVVGSWAGDRIALIGDYAERGDLKPKDNADLIYVLCNNKNYVKTHLANLKLSGGQQEARRLRRQLTTKGVFRDISLAVAAVLEQELGGKFTGTGWRQWECGK